MGTEDLALKHRDILLEALGDFIDMRHDDYHEGGDQRSTLLSAIAAYEHIALHPRVRLTNEEALNFEDYVLEQLQAIEEVARRQHGSNRDWGSEPIIHYADLPAVDDDDNN